MNISIAILHRYPSLDPSKDFFVQDDSDGNGAYLAEWNRTDIQQPTETELNQWWSEYQANPPQPEPTMEERVRSMEDAITVLMGL